MLKIITKLFRREKTAVYFIFGCLFLFFWMLCSCNIAPGNARVVFFNKFFNNAKAANLGKNMLFSSQNSAILLETPDLKIMQDNTLGGIATPSIVSGKVLGDVFGSSSSQNKKEIIDYTVQPGDTLQSVAASYNISVNTLIWANDLTTSSKLKVGQSLAILPVDGVVHVVKSGDTILGIASKYKAKSDDVVAYNNLAAKDDIYIGDILIVPDGTMPKQSGSVAVIQVPVADDFFIFPVQGQISQGLHYYNAVDIRNKCGTPVYAAAAGVVQRAVSNGAWNQGMGNHITILHSNGTVTYYGHLMTVLVKPGDKVYTGQNIALMGGQPGMAGAGKSTGCHVHFQVVGAKNPLSKYAVGANISYK